MATIKVLRGNTSSIANYAGSAGEVALNSDTGNVVFWTNTANKYYTFSPPPPLIDYFYQGDIAGYYGMGSDPAATRVNIYSVSFASDTPASDTGIDSISFPTGSNGASGTFSSTNAYMIGHSSPVWKGTIARFPFALDTNMTDVGELAVLPGANNPAYGTAMSETQGYVYGGSEPGPSPGPNYATDRIQKFPFSSDTSATDASELSQARYFSGGGSTIQSLSFAYAVAGGSATLAATDTIDKFPFASDAPATDVGETSHTSEGDFTTCSSTTSGYKLGGQPGYTTTTIDKFPFSSDTSATDVGELVQGGTRLGGACGSVAGYVFGGRIGPSSYTDMIQKMPYNSDTSSTDIAELHTPVYWVWSHAAQ